MDYQGNSNKEKAKKEEVEVLVTGEVIKRRKSIGHKFKTIFFGGDARAALNFVTSEVLLPALRNLIVDSVSKGTDRLVYGDNSPRRHYPYETRSRIQYNNPIYRRDPRANIPDQGRPMRTLRRDATDVILSTREEAESVVERLILIIEKYDVVTLAELNEILGLESQYTDQKWGWTFLNNVGIRQVREGYLIEFPSLEEI